MRRIVRRAVAAAAALCLSAACGGSPASPGPAPDPVAAVMRPYLDEVGARIVSVMREDKHLGVYVRPDPAWDVDRYVSQLPRAAEAARELLARFPEYDDVDVCADGPWLPHPSGIEFVPASRLQLYRDRLARLPARFERPSQVMRSGLFDLTVDFYLDPKILTESALYREERKAAS